MNDHSKGVVVLGVIGLAAVAVVMASRARAQPSGAPFAPEPTSPPPAPPPKVDTTGCAWTWVPDLPEYSELPPDVKKRAKELNDARPDLGSEFVEEIGGTLYKFRRTWFLDGDSATDGHTGMHVQRCVRRKDAPT